MKYAPLFVVVDNDDNEVKAYELYEDAVEHAKDINGRVFVNDEVGGMMFDAKTEVKTEPEKAKDKYDWVTPDMFNDTLETIMLENLGTLLHVPGVFEALSEHFNNDVLQRLEDERDG